MAKQFAYDGNLSIFDFINLLLFSWIYRYLSTKLFSMDVNFADGDYARRNLWIYVGVCYG